MAELKNFIRLTQVLGWESLKNGKLKTKSVYVNKNVITQMEEEQWIDGRDHFHTLNRISIIGGVSYCVREDPGYVDSKMK